MRPRSLRFPRASLVARVALLLRRDPRIWWLAVVSCALAAGMVVAAFVARAERTHQAWGTSELVLVAVRDLAPGDLLTSGDVELARRPTAMVPSSALRAMPDQATVSAEVLAGEIVVAERLTAEHLSALAARLPRGTRAVAIPVEPGVAPPLSPGDHVDVLVALPIDQRGGGPPGFAVAVDALVVAVDEASVTVAVPRDVAPRIGVALGQGAVTLALIGAEH